jgi:hypothetical protein
LKPYLSSGRWYRYHLITLSDCRRRNGLAVNAHFATAVLVYQYLRRQYATAGRV